MTHNLCLQNLCTLNFQADTGGCAVTHLLGLQVQIQAEAWMCVSCECCVLSGRGFCDEPSTHPLDFY